jgi:hypothetical protein
MKSALLAPFRVIRIAVFGATAPLRWLNDAFRGAAAELDPRQADVRTIAPADPPQWVEVDPPEPGGIHGHEAPRPGRHGEPK